MNKQKNRIQLGTIHANTDPLEKLAKEIGRGFDDLSVELGKLAPVVAKSVREIEESFAKATARLTSSNKE